MAILPHCLNIIRCDLSSIYFPFIVWAQRRSHRWNCICAASAPNPGLSRCTALSSCRNSRGRGSQHHVSRAMAVSCTDHTPVVRGSRVRLARSTAPSQWVARDGIGADINPWMCSQSPWPKVCRTNPLNIRFIRSVSLLPLWWLCRHMLNATSRLSLLHTQIHFVGGKRFGKGRL